MQIWAITPRGIFTSTNFKHVLLPFSSSCTYKICFAVSIRWRIVALLCHILDDELLCRTFLHATWTLVFLCFNQLLIDDMWWSKLNKINHLCCCNEKDSFFFFLWPRFHSSLMETWMNWMSVPHLQGQGDKYYAWLLLRHVWLPAEKQLFHSAVLTARHVLFQIKPSRSQSHLFVSKRRQNGILRNNNKFTVDVRNHNKFSVS